MAEKADKVIVENINTPGKTTRVDKNKYEAMRKALVKVLPKKSPGLTFAQAKEKVIPLLPEDLFPEGATSGWWLKTTQLDLEAKGDITRESTKPIRWYRT